MQRSEGGGLAGGGSPTGLMSARGAGDFLTRTTAILAAIFVLLSIGLAALATVNRAPAELDESLVKTPGTVPTTPLPGPASGAVPLAGQPAPSTQAPPTIVPAEPIRAPAPPAPRRLAPGENVPMVPQRRQAVPDAPPEKSGAAAAPSTPAVTPTTPAAPPSGDAPQ